MRASLKEHGTPVSAATASARVRFAVTKSTSADADDALEKLDSVNYAAHSITLVVQR